MAWLASLTGAFLAGLLIPLQTGINAQFARALGHPITATMLSFAIGTVALVGYMLVLRVSWPAKSLLASLPWWIYTGGIVASVYVTATVLLAPRLGALSMFALIMTGQAVASMVFDHFGWLGFPEHPFSWLRLLGMAFLLAGVILVQRF